MARQALYLRYRPKRFAQVKGQQHLVKALQSAVRDGTAGHAYLLHGPRGTGKTTTARLLAKALNCTDLGEDGEPCCACESCASIQENRSFDLYELDAASNNKVDDMRQLLERVALATPGRSKVYLLDEVHMLTPGAENALLKTLEEPPSHVTWVLATTEPHKVAETIRSRCQVFELGLLGADLMADHLRYVAADAGIDADDSLIDYAVAKGAGSVRDALSALDAAVPGVDMAMLDSTTGDILDAIAGHDPAAALAAVDDAVGRGRAPRSVGEAALAGLRDGFLTKMGVPPPRLSDKDSRRAESLAKRMTAAAMTRALETLGRALVDMRQAPDERVHIEVALVRLCRAEAGDPLEQLSRRVDWLESKVKRMEVASRPPGRSSQPPPPVPAAVPPRGLQSRPGQPADAARAAARAQRKPPRSPARAGPSASRSASSRRPGSRRGGQLAQSASEVDLRSLEPQSPFEVVAWAEQHLGISKPVVVARAKQMLRSDKGSHTPEELLALWHSLVDEHSRADPAQQASSDAAPPVTAPVAASPPGAAASPREAGSPADGGAVAALTLAGMPGEAPALDEGAEAASRLEAQIAEAFPGVEFADAGEAQPGQRP